jgi:hypothetical protein
VGSPFGEQEYKKRRRHEATEVLIPPDLPKNILHD